MKFWISSTFLVCGVFWSIFSSQLKRLQWSQLSVSHLKNKNSLPRISALDWFDLTKKRTLANQTVMVGGLHLNDVLIAHGACLVCCGYAIGLIVPPASLSLGATLWQIFPQEHFDFQFLTFETCLLCLDSTSAQCFRSDSRICWKENSKNF